MATLKQRHNKWQAKVRVPGAIAKKAGGSAFLYRTLASGDKRAARAEADVWEAHLRAQWAIELGHAKPEGTALRAVYEATRRAGAAGEFVAYGHPDLSPAEFAIDLMIDELEDEATKSRGELAPLKAAKLAGLMDALHDLDGKEPPRRKEFEPTLSELAGTYVDQWRRSHSLKGNTNTEQQKRATLALFASYCGDRAIRDVTKQQALGFLEKLRTLDPNWARSPANRELPWEALYKTCGNHPTGLQDATMNRHVATLKAFWAWAEDHEKCSGKNPFEGRHTKLRMGTNVRGYLPWEPDELSALFDPPPRRADLVEVMIVGLFTGMRLDEIASLRGEQVREREGVTYIRVEDAKTPAGNREVPLHSRIGWLKDRAAAAGKERVWSGFNPEGPGKKPGADAGRDFSRFKASRGFTSRQKAFHSFRKNVTRIMERAGVPENEWAQVFGHERGFTYGRYNPDGITLGRKAEIIGLIDYGALALPPIQGQ